MRISIISDPESVNPIYRAYLPASVVSWRGHEIEVNRPGAPPFQRPSLLNADVVHVHRFIDPEAQRAVAMLRERGVGIVWDNDDDILSVPRANPNHAHYRGLAGRRLRTMLTAMVRLADVVTTPSEVLATQFRDAGARDVRVIENYLPREFVHARRDRHDGVVVGWLAGLEHVIDYQHLGLRPVLQALLDAHPDLTIASIGLGLGLPKERCHHVAHVEHAELPPLLARWDVGIAPIADIPWSQARSNVKVKEYAATGVAWLASDASPYRGLGEKQGGRLVADSEWHAAIERLITRARERRGLAKRGAKWAKGQTIDRHADVWEQVFADAAARGRARAAAGPSAQAVEAR